MTAFVFVCVLRSSEDLGADVDAVVEHYKNPDTRPERGFLNKGKDCVGAKLRSLVDYEKLSEEAKESASSKSSVLSTGEAASALPLIAILIGAALVTAGMKCQSKNRG